MMRRGWPAPWRGGRTHDVEAFNGGCSSLGRPLGRPPPALANIIYDYDFNTSLGEVAGTITFASITGCATSTFCSATAVTVQSSSAGISTYGTYPNIDINQFNIDGAGIIVFSAFDSYDAAFANHIQLNSPITSFTGICQGGCGGLFGSNINDYITDA